MKSSKIKTNSRGAGRKPLGIFLTNIKVTLPEELRQPWDGVLNKTEFVRKAVAEKLKKRLKAIKKSKSKGS